eukprot:2221598-Pyramimonas_sp.AAC.1
MIYHVRIYERSAPEQPRHAHGATNLTGKQSHLEESTLAKHSNSSTSDEAGRELCILQRGVAPARAPATPNLCRSLNPCGRPQRRLTGAPTELELWGPRDLNLKPPGR